MMKAGPLGRLFCGPCWREDRPTGPTPFYLLAYYDLVHPTSLLNISRWRIVGMFRFIMARRGWSCPEAFMVRIHSLLSVLLLATGFFISSSLFSNTEGQFSFTGSAQAQSYQYMSCNQLWHARNAIYARQGYCFKTRRARQVFGPRCYAPWGRLTASQQRRVNRIVSWERRFGCR